MHSASNNTVQILSKFFQDKFNVKIGDFTTEADVGAMIQQATLAVGPVDDAFIRILSNVKEQLKEHLKRHQMQQMQQQQQMSLQHPSLQMQQQISSGAKPFPSQPSQELLTTEDGTATVAAFADNDLMAVVRKYEEERSRNRTIGQMNVSNVSNVSNAANATNSTFQSTNGNQSLNTVNVNGSVNYFAINGHERNWQFSPGRNTIIWNGPLPRGNIDIEKIVLPAAVCRSTPYVVVEIRGAGQRSGQQVLATTNASVATGGNESGWAIYQPIHTAMKPLATPWSIKLLDAYGEMQLGDDDATIVEARSTMFLVKPATLLSFQPGDRILVQPTNADAINTFVQGISRSTEKNAILMDMEIDVKLAIGARILNLGRQASMVFSVKS